jgi:serine/threonine protein phosphatase 1
MPVLAAIGALTRKRATLPSVPPGQRIWAIGDIHGRADLLEQLLERIEHEEERLSPSRVSIIFLGDLVDRGPDSKGVLDRIVALRAASPDVRVLRGNHDDVFLRAIKGDVRSMRHLVRMGGRETVLSYGISEAEYTSVDFASLVDHVQELVPQSHVELLESMEAMIVTGDYVFVHAGVRPDVPLDEQSEADLYWIRNEFLNCRKPFEKFVIHGHSITDEEEIRPNRIGVDTGAFASGKLTAIGLEGQDRFFLST